MPAQLKQEETSAEFAAPKKAAKPRGAARAPEIKALPPEAEIQAPESQEAQTWRTLTDKGQAFYRRSETNLGADLDYAASKLAVDVAFALSEELEDFDGFDPTFRRGLQRAARRALLWVFRSEKKVVVMPDALPGYTILAFKKDPHAKAPSVRSAAKSAGDSIDGSGLAQESLEGQAAASLVAEYMKTRNDSRVMAIESADAIFALFPTSDTRRNLREMGFWFAGSAVDE